MKTKEEIRERRLNYYRSKKMSREFAKDIMRAQFLHLIEDHIKLFGELAPKEIRKELEWILDEK